MNATATGNPEVRRIRRISSGLAGACLFLMLLMPAFDAFIWAWGDVPVLTLIAKLASGTVKTPLLAWQRVAGGLIWMLPIGCQMAALWQSRKCFQLFASGLIFVLEAVRCLRRFAAWILASIVADNVAHVALAAVLVASAEPAERHLVIGLGVESNTLLFIGMVWLMAAVIDHGQSIAEENANFV